ncbi:hypothetical protein FDP44_09630 [Coxiella burnetii]|nr:hypothetical protein FDP44_09630 [Coxiella burnetii]
MTSAVKALDSLLSVDGLRTGNDRHFFNSLIVPLLPRSLKLTPMRLRGNDGNLCF